jgi:hypothetical protein
MHAPAQGQDDDVHPDQPAPQDRQARGVHRAVPVAILSDCVVHAAEGTSLLDCLPYQDGKPLPGGFELGINPGLVKHERTQSVLWDEEVRERFNAPELNLARYIKDGTVTDVDDGEQARHPWPPSPPARHPACRSAPAPPRSRDPTALTVPEIRHQLADVLTSPAMTTARLLRWSAWRGRHQATARRGHHRRRSADEPAE